MSKLFIKKFEQTMPNGEKLLYRSRMYRKVISPLSKTEQIWLKSKINPWSYFFAPKRLSWWIAILFLIGSFLFAFGSFSSNWNHLLSSKLFSALNINLIFFIGSLFFTSAALLQMIETDRHNIVDLVYPNTNRIVKLLKNAGFLSALSQFAGTILFNFNTLDAMKHNLNWLKKDFFIWMPDIIGSILFLVSSFFAFLEIYDEQQLCFDSIEFWIVVLNALGSVAFFISALFAYYLPHLPDTTMEYKTNLFTFIGAVLFFFASYLMIPEQFGTDIKK